MLRTATLQQSMMSAMLPERTEDIVNSLLRMLISAYSVEEMMGRLAANAERREKAAIELGQARYAEEMQKAADEATTHPNAVEALQAEYQSICEEGRGMQTARERHGESARKAAVELERLLKGAYVTAPGHADRRHGYAARRRWSGQQESAGRIRDAMLN